MISGAVIIGRPIGPGMFHPFTKSDFYSLKDYCHFALFAECPFEVAYPKTINNPKLEYQEGVIVNITEGNDENEFLERVRDRLIFSAKKSEIIYNEAMMGKRELPWEGKSKLHYQKVCHPDIGKDGKWIWPPFMEIIKTYPEELKNVEYLQIVSDLLFKTRDARIKNYNENQKYVLSSSLEMLMNWVGKSK